MESPLLAAVLIVKDEQDDLPGCLESLQALRPLLSDVVVYDTGSTDSTVKVARDYGCRVVRGHWDGDFARARNDAASHADAQWVLSIDADERVVADTARLGQVLRQGLVDGGSGWDVVNVTILDLDSGGRPLARHPFCKLFRPTRAAWTSPIHETLAPIREASEFTVVELPEAVFHLRHHGYADAARRRAKAARNAGVARGGRVTAASNLPPDRLATLLVDEGRALAASECLDEAAACFASALEVADVAPAARRFILQEAIAFLSLRRDAAAAEPLLVELEQDPEAVDAAQWLRANVLIDVGRPAEALPILRGLRRLRLGRSLELDGSIAVATLMRAAVDAGEFDEALACAIQLVASTGDVERYGRQLMRLWGDQPPALLAQLLGGVVNSRREVVAAGLEGLPAPGPEVAACLRSAS